MVDLYSDLQAYNASFIKLLDHVQHAALLMTTGRFTKTPFCHFNMFSIVLPLGLTIQNLVIETYLRLKITSTSTTRHKLTK